MGYNKTGPIEKQIFVIEEIGRSSAFLKWYFDLGDFETRARVRARLVRMQSGNLGDCSSVGSGVYELRMFFGPGYRVYFVLRGEAVIILLCGGDKSTQKRDIKQAQRIWREFRNETSKLRRFSC